MTAYNQLLAELSSLKNMPVAFKVTQRTIERCLSPRQSSVSSY